MKKHLLENKPSLYVIIKWMLGGLFVLLSTTLYAQTSLRSAEDAFAFSVESIDSTLVGIQQMQILHLTLAQQLTITLHYMLSTNQKHIM